MRGQVVVAKNTLIIAAGGIGKRTGLDIPKQFYTIKDKPVIAHTISVFEKMDEIDEIIISCHKDYISHTMDIVNKYNLSKVVSVVEGGDTRQQSVFKALCKVSDDTEYVLIHDAARPFINQDSIRRCMLDAKISGCASVGKRVSDTLKRSDEEGYIEDTVDRNNLWQIQTPQIFKFHIIYECHKKCIEDDVSCTDDCMICERYGHRIKITQASCINMKLTDKSDILIAEAILNV